MYIAEITPELSSFTNLPELLKVKDLSKIELLDIISNKYKRSWVWAHHRYNSLITKEIEAYKIKNQTFFRLKSNDEAKD
jgi:hypothetical protein